MQKKYFFETIMLSVIGIPQDSTLRSLIQRTSRITGMISLMIQLGKYCFMGLIILMVTYLTYSFKPLMV